MIARNIDPGIFRKEFAFEKWVDFNQELFDEIYNDDSQEREFEHKIYGFDNNPKAHEIALFNVKAAGVSRDIVLKVQPIQQFTKPAEKALMVTNPPYGERISTNDLLGLYKIIGTKLKHEFSGNDAWILSYREECFEQIGLKPSEKIELYNGALECQFRKYELFDGRYKDFKTELNENGEEVATGEEGDKPKYERREPRERSERGERRSFGDRKPREGGERRSFGDRKPREGGERRSFGDRAPREGGERRSFGDRKPREDGERRPFRSREDGERRSFGDRKPREDGERRPFRAREGGERRSFGDRKPREDGERRSFRSREGGERRSFGDRAPREPKSRETLREERKNLFDKGTNE